MARVCPVTMIFIPCRGGVSHRPDEYASPEAHRAGHYRFSGHVGGAGFPGNERARPPFPPPRRVAGSPAPAPGQPEPLAHEPPGSRWLAVPGFLILVGCLEAGELLKARLGLVLPGNILGLFLLLSLLMLGVVPLRWVENAARLLLWLLPFLFVPIFVPTIRDRELWLVQGRSIAGAVLMGTLLLWAAVGHLSQFLLRRAERTKPHG